MKAWAGSDKMQQQIIVPDHHADEPGHDLIHQLGNYVGYPGLLLAVAIGGFVLWKKKIKGWLK